MMPWFLLLLPLWQAQPVAAPSYVPQRVYDGRQKGFSDFESMLADASHADAVFVGEQHDDANTHRLELAILEGLYRRTPAIVLALEMFERDVQPALDGYLAGSSTEEQFLAAARPWPHYATDYRPLIEFAKAHHLRVIASNIPRPIAAEVSRTGLGAIDALGDRRSLAASELLCPTSGEYYRRFLEVMGGGTHPGAAEPDADTHARNDRFYFAQCVKDETMGESVARAVAEPGDPHPIVLHVNGSFHSDYGQGTVDSARRRLPGRRLVVVSAQPIADLDRAVPDDPKVADYLLFTLK